MIGKYKHYKGGLYEVIGLGVHTETNEKLVIYCDRKGEIWLRPKDMFLSKVHLKGKEIDRFVKVDKD